MTLSRSRPPRKPSALQLYWPIAALVAVAGVIGYFSLSSLLGGDDDNGEVASGDSTSTTVAETTDTPAADTPAAEPTMDDILPVTFQEAEANGELDQTEFLGDCDPETGRIAIPTIWAAPCITEPASADRSKAGRGVTDDEIIVAYYLPGPGDLGALIQEAFDSPEDERATTDNFASLFEEKYEMWGRTVRFVPIQATGVTEGAARADALKVADEIGAFASLGGPSQAPAYANELAKKGVLCLNCGLGVPDSTYQDAAPYMWGSLQTPEQFLVNLTDYIEKKLNNKPAEFAGDPEMRTQTRRWGVVHFEQDPPVYTEVRRFAQEYGASRDWEAETYLTYLLNFDTMAEQARTIIAQLKENDVTTVIFLGDPTMPGALTLEATVQDYFPEWIITGTFMTDTTYMGRAYDQSQWANAFGISSLPVPMGYQNQQAWTLHEWWTGETPPAVNTVRVVFEVVHQLYLGIHMAGPELTPETFQQGLFKYPTAGGFPNAPAVSYGDGVFEAPDYQGYDDIVEIWWDPDAEGQDETGAQGRGMMRYANNGQRYMPGDVPDGPVGAFDPDNSITTWEGREIPPEWLPPSYPSPNEQN